MTDSQTYYKKYGKSYFKDIRGLVKSSGLANVDPERIKEISAMGVEARRKKREAKNSLEAEVATQSEEGSESPSQAEETTEASPN